MPPRPLILEMVKNKYKDFVEELDKAWLKVSGDKLALCIGAGVTRNYVGEWGTLLNKLAILRVGDTLTQQWASLEPSPVPRFSRLEDYITSQDGFFPKDMSVLEQGEYLLEDVHDFSYTRRKPGLVGDNDVDDDNDAMDMSVKKQHWMETFFSEQVVHAINQTQHEKTSGKKLGDHFKDHCDEKYMGTLRHVLGICLSGQVEYVINYNFDTIFEQLLVDYDVCKTVEPCEDKWPEIEVFAYKDKKIDSLSCDRSDHAEPALPRVKLRIYHVHGVALQKEGAEDPHIGFPLIFSENSYLEYQRELLNWSQRRIADVMQTNNLLCVGFSGTDANFRHLTRMMNKSHKNAYMRQEPRNKIWITQRLHEKFMKHSQRAGSPYAFACLKMFTESAAQYFYKHFGVTILWVEDYNRMADRLAKIYQ